VQRAAGSTGSLTLIVNGQSSQPENTGAAGIFSVEWFLPDGLASGVYDPGPPGGYNAPIWRNKTGAPVWITNLTWKQPGNSGAVNPPNYIITAKVYSSAQPNVAGATIGTFSNTNGITGYTDIVFTGFAVTQIPADYSIYLEVDVGGGGSTDLPFGVLIQATFSNTAP
jgi:hypothetical protein